MPILLTNHIQSNMLLANAAQIDISINQNMLHFNVYFDKKEYTHGINKWYKPTMRKFFYTLCKQNIDDVWSCMINMAEDEKDPSSMGLLMRESWERNDSPTITKKLRFECIKVEVVDEFKLHAEAEMNYHCFSNTSVEVFDFIPSETPRDILSRAQEDIKIMMLDATNFGIKNGLVKPDHY